MIKMLQSTVLPLHVSVDGGGGEDVLVIESVMELLHHSCIFGDADGLRC